MKTVYAIQFDICPQTSDTQSAMLAVEQLIAAWVQRKYKKAWVTDMSLEFQDIVISPLPQHTIATSIQESDEFRYFQLEWTHPDDQDKSMLWRTSLILCANKDKIEISIVIRIASAEFIVKPVTGYIFGRPGVVNDILSNFECDISGETIPTQHRVLSNGDDVAQFVNDVLENPNRTIPIVMMSQDVWTNSYFVDPEILQRKLLGYARGNS